MIAVFKDSSDIPASRNGGCDSKGACGLDNAFYNSETGSSNTGTLYLASGTADAAYR